MDIKTLSKLEDSYFFQEREKIPTNCNPNSKFQVPYLQDNNILEPQFSEQLKSLYQMYDEACNINGQAGYSKTIDSFYLKVIEIKYYRRGGFLAKPFYFILNKEGGLSIKENQKFEKYFNQLRQEFDNDPNNYRQLNKIGIMHVLPEGNIVEYILKDGEEMHYSNVFSEMSKIHNQFALKYRLDNELNDNTIKIQTNKI